MFKISNFFNETLKNASKLLVGTLIAQAIPIIISFYLARLFSKSSFGIYGIYMSTISILFVVVNMKYETTILLPKKEKDANTLVGISIFFAVILSIIIAFLILLFKLDILYFKEWKESKTWLYFVPFSILAVGIYQPFNYWLIRKKKYTESSLNKITQRFTEAPANVLFGLKGNLYGLVIGDLIGRVLMSIQAIYQSIRAGFSFKNISIDDYKNMLKRYKSFAIINTLPSLANTLATHTPLFIITNMYGWAIAGQFTLVRTVLSIPVSLVSNNISQVVFQQVSERVSNKKRFRSVLKNVFLLLLSLSIAMVLLFVPFGNYIFKLYGLKWDLAGLMSQILVVSFAFKFLISSFSKILLSLEKINWISYWQVTYLILVGILYLLTKHFQFSITNFLYVYLTIDIVAYILYAIIINKSINDYHIDKED